MNLIFARHFSPFLLFVYPPISLYIFFSKTILFFYIVLQVKQPILFISGLQDEMVPPTHMKMLYAKAAARNRRCYFVEFPTGMHMDTWLTGGDRYWRTVNEFMEEHVSVNMHDESNSSSTGNL